jgi:hypothetical protein
MAFATCAACQLWKRLLKPCALSTTRWRHTFSSLAATTRTSSPYKEREAARDVGALKLANRLRTRVSRQSSEAILALKPVTFRYKQEIDPKGIPQFGLVAEEVEKVNPDLVVRDADGKVYTVRYEAVNAMLLNEFLKEHRKNEEQEKTIVELKSGMTALAATVKEQSAQIQKVGAQLATASPSRGGLEASKFAIGRIRRGGTAPQVVNNP